MERRTGETGASHRTLRTSKRPLTLYGVIIVLVGEMGVITPPVGVNVFVIKGIAPDIPLETIFKGIFPFLVALIIMTIVLTIFPQIATFLPSLIPY